MGGDTQRKLYQRKRYFLGVKRYVEDVKQDEKSIPDLLESIMKGSGPVKEELRLIFFKVNQLRPKITKIRVSTFGCPENRRIPAGGQHSLLAQ